MARFGYSIRPNVACGVLVVNCGLTRLAHFALRNRSELESVPWVSGHVGVFLLVGEHPLDYGDIQKQ
jgi:hypothetical protein